MKQLSLVLSAVGLLSMAACATDDEETTTPMVASQEWLLENANNPNVQILDAYQPPHRTLADYEAGHIPGAVPFDVSSTTTGFPCAGAELSAGA